MRSATRHASSMPRAATTTATAEAQQTTRSHDGSRTSHSVTAAAEALASALSTSSCSSIADSAHDSSSDTADDMVAAAKPHVARTLYRADDDDDAATATTRRNACMLQPRMLCDSGDDRRWWCSKTHVASAMRVVDDECAARQQLLLNDTMHVEVRVVDMARVRVLDAATYRGVVQQQRLQQQQEIRVGDVVVRGADVVNVLAAHDTTAGNENSSTADDDAVAAAAAAALLSSSSRHTSSAHSRPRAHSRNDASTDGGHHHSSSSSSSSAWASRVTERLAQLLSSSRAAWPDGYRATVRLQIIFEGLVKLESSDIAMHPDAPMRWRATPLPATASSPSSATAPCVRTLSCHAMPLEVILASLPASALHSVVKIRLLQLPPPPLPPPPPPVVTTRRRRRHARDIHNNSSGGGISIRNDVVVAAHDSYGAVDSVRNRVPSTSTTRNSWQSNTTLLTAAAADGNDNNNNNTTAGDAEDKAAREPVCIGVAKISFERLARAGRSVCVVLQPKTTVMQLATRWCGLGGDDKAAIDRLFGVRDGGSAFVTLHIVLYLFGHVPLRRLLLYHKQHLVPSNELTQQQQQQQQQQRRSDARALRGRPAQTQRDASTMTTATTRASVNDDNDDDNSLDNVQPLPLTRTRHGNNNNSSSDDDEEDDASGSDVALRSPDAATATTAAAAAMTDAFSSAAVHFMLIPYIAVVDALLRVHGILMWHRPSKTMLVLLIVVLVLLNDVLGVALVLVLFAQVVSVLRTAMVLYRVPVRDYHGVPLVSAAAAATGLGAYLYNRRNALLNAMTRARLFFLHGLQEDSFYELVFVLHLVRRRQGDVYLAAVLFLASVVMLSLESLALVLLVCAFVLYPLHVRARDAACMPRARDSGNTTAAQSRRARGVHSVVASSLWWPHTWRALHSALHVVRIVQVSVVSPPPPQQQQQQQQQQQRQRATAVRGDVSLTTVTSPQLSFVQSNNDNHDVSANSNNDRMPQRDRRDKGAVGVDDGAVRGRGRGGNVYGMVASPSPAPLVAHAPRSKPSSLEQTQQQTQPPRQSLSQLLQHRHSLSYSPAMPQSTIDALTSASHNTSSNNTPAAPWQASAPLSFAVVTLTYASAPAAGAGEAAATAYNGNSSTTSSSNNSTVAATMGGDAAARRTRRAAAAALDVLRTRVLRHAEQLQRLHEVMRTANYATDAMREHADAAGGSSNSNSNSNNAAAAYTATAQRSMSLTWASASAASGDGVPAAGALPGPAAATSSLPPWQTFDAYTQYYRETLALLTFLRRQYTLQTYVHSAHEAAAAAAAAAAAMTTPSSSGVDGRYDTTATASSPLSSLVRLDSMVRREWLWKGTRPNSTAAALVLTQPGSLPVAAVPRASGCEAAARTLALLAATLLQGSYVCLFCPVTTRQHDVGAVSTLTATVCSTVLPLVSGSGAVRRLPRPNPCPPQLLDMLDSIWRGLATHAQHGSGSGGGGSGGNNNGSSSSSVSSVGGADDGVAVAPVTVDMVLHIVHAYMHACTPAV